MRAANNRIRRSTGPGFRQWYGIIGLGTLLLFLYVSEQVAVVVLERQIHAVTEEAAELTVQVGQLKMRHSELRKGARIKQIAMDDLGLRMPERIPGVLF